MSEATSTVRPFYCGTQFGDWSAANCGTCTKAATEQANYVDGRCDIERALSESYLLDGTISLPIADRMGRSAGRYNWPCREHDPPFVNVRADGTVDESVRPEAGA